MVKQSFWVKNAHNYLLQSCSPPRWTGKELLCRLCSSSTQGSGSGWLHPCQCTAQENQSVLVKVTLTAQGFVSVTLRVSVSPSRGLSHAALVCCRCLDDEVNESGILSESGDAFACQDRNPWNMRHPEFMASLSIWAPNFIVPFLVLPHDGYGDFKEQEKVSFNIMRESTILFGQYLVKSWESFIT